MWFGCLCALDTNFGIWAWAFACLWNFACECSLTSIKFFPGYKTHANKILVLATCNRWIFACGAPTHYMKSPRTSLVLHVPLTSRVTRVTRMAYSPRLWLMAIGWWNKINQCRNLKLNLTQIWQRVSNALRFIAGIAQTYTHTHTNMYTHTHAHTHTHTHKHTHIYTR